MSVASELTKTAKAQIGNGGSKYRRWYYGTSSDCYGIEWCAVFISWLFDQIGGINKYIIKSDGAGSFARYGDGRLGADDPLTVAQLRTLIQRLAALR